MILNIICTMFGAIIGFMTLALMQAVKEDRQDDVLIHVSEPVIRSEDERICPYRRNISCNILEDAHCGDCEVKKW